MSSIVATKLRFSLLSLSTKRGSSFLNVSSVRHNRLCVLGAVVPTKAYSQSGNSSLLFDEEWGTRRREPLASRRLSSTVASWSDLIQSVTQNKSPTTNLGFPADSSLDSNVFKVREQLTQALAARRSHEQGNLLPNVIASEICKLYVSLESQSDKVAFFALLSSSLDVDLDLISKAIASFNQNKLREEATFLKARERLSSILDPAYKHLLKDIGHLEEGVKTLVNMRKDLLGLFADKSIQGITPHLHAFERHLKQHLAQWFSAGFLDLQMVTWASPAALLEKIMAYEQVHPTRRWNDFKRRLDLDRRCFIFNHRLLPGEPLVILHTALGDHLRANMEGILVQSNTNHSQEVTAATFYSISSTQKGLSGIDLGNYLIKVVVQKLKNEFPSIIDFGTLSPIPGFAKWLNQKLKNDQGYISELWDKSSASPFRPESFDMWLHQLQQCNDKDADNVDHYEANKKFLLTLCARYLYCEKRRGFSLDPVANFHLRNGAIFWRLNWMADKSNRGMERSFGIMTNYKYDLSQIEDNNKQYVIDGKIAVSEAVLDVIRQGNKS